ncbi:hypothetical protein GCM10009646_79060 [Streptomyces aureus]
MQGFVDDADEREVEDVQSLRELSVALSVDGDEPNPRLVTDGGRPGDPEAEAEAVAGPETQDEQELEGKRQAIDEVHGRDGPEVRGDGQLEIGAQAFGGGR